MVKKRPRDPNAPKRNMSTYLLYQNAMRDQFKTLNPGLTFGQLAKYTSTMYSAMPSAEKEAWEARAEADKARYIHELASYTPPPGYDPRGDAIILPSVHPTVGDSHALPVVPQQRAPKAEKDVNAPKRNISAYILYQNAMREQFKRENPGMTFGQLAKFISHMYKNLTPEEKATWDACAQQDKARYDLQLANYNPPPGHDARGNMIEGQRAVKRRSKRKPKDPNAPKRASGAYVFFTNEMRPVVMKQFPGIKFVEMGRILGERWRGLTPPEKKRFETMAIEDKTRYQMEMQQYSADKALQHQQYAMSQHQLQQQHIQAPITMQAVSTPHGHYNIDPHQYQHIPQHQHQHNEYYDPHQYH